MSIDLNTINDKTYLQKLIENSKDFEQVINETNGFVFYLLEKNGIFPDKKMLINFLSAPMLNFLLKNYELDEQESVLISSYFSDRSTVVENKVFEEQAITDRVKNSSPIPSNTVLSYKVLKENQQEISNRLLQEYSFKKVYAKSIEALSMQEILDLDVLISTHPYETMISTYHGDKTYKQIYLKAIDKKLNFYKEKPGYELLNNIVLEEKDKKLVKKILSKGRYYDKKYGQYKKITNFTKLISPLEFFKSYNHEDLTYLSKEDIIANKFDIQGLFFKDRMLKSVEFYDSISDNLDKLELLIDDELIKNYLNSHYGYFDVSESPKTSKIIIKKIFNYLAKNIESVEFEKVNSLIYLARYMEGDESNDFLKSYTKYCITSQNIKDYNNRFGSGWGKHDIFQDNFFTTERSIDKFYIMLLVSRNHSIFSEVKKYIDEYLTHLDYKEASLLVRYFNLKGTDKYLNNSINKKDSFISRGDFPEDMYSFLINDSIFIEQVIVEKKQLPSKLLIEAINNNKKDFIKAYYSIFEISDYEKLILKKTSWSNEIYNNKEQEKVDLNDFLNKKAKSSPPDISSDVLEEKIIELIKEENFNKLEKLGDNFSIKDQVIKQFSELNSQQLALFFKNEKFKKILKNYAENSYNHEDKIKLDWDLETLRQAVKVFPETTNVAYWTKDKEVLKQYLIKYDPKDLFYGYHREIDFDAKDIFSAFKNVGDSKKFFQKININSSFKDVLCALSFDEYLSLKDMAKETPVLYLLLATYSVKNYEWFEDRENIDKQLHEMMIKNFDFDIILKGIEQILKDISYYEHCSYRERDKDRFDTSKALYAIESFLINTNYEEKEDFMTLKVLSALPEENTQRLIALLLKMAPCLLMSRAIIGGVYIEHHIDSIVNTHPYDLNDLIFNTITPQYYKGEKNDILINAVINDKIKKQDYISLSYIYFLIKAIDFENHVRSDSGINKIQYQCLLSKYKDEQSLDKLNIFDVKFFLNNSLLQGKNETAKIKKVSKL